MRLAQLDTLPVMPTLKILDIGECNITDLCACMFWHDETSVFGSKNLCIWWDLKIQKSNQYDLDPELRIDPKSTIKLEPRFSDFSKEDSWSYSPIRTINKPLL